MIKTILSKLTVQMVHKKVMRKVTNGKIYVGLFARCESHISIVQKAIKKSNLLRLHFIRIIWKSQ